MLLSESFLVFTFKTVKPNFTKFTLFKTKTENRRGISLFFKTLIRERSF